MSTILGDLVLRISGDASGGEQALGETQGGLQGIMSPANMVKGAMMAGGVAATAMAQKVQPLNEMTDRLGTVTGLGGDAIRDMTLDLTDATFPIEDVHAGMEKLVEMGYDTEEQFRDILPVMDQFADATGRDITDAIGTAEKVLGAFNIPMEEAHEHIDTLTYVTEKTSIPLGTLERNLGRIPDELDAMNMDLDDSVAYIEMLEDQGYTGQEAVREFRRAVEEAGGDQDKLNEILNVSSEELGEYNERIAGADGLTADMADTVRTGPWAEFQQKLSEITYQYGEQIEMVGQWGFVMSGAIPVLSSLGGGIKALGAFAGKAMIPALLGAVKATWAFTAALLANPITWIVLLIVGLIAAIVLLWKNWDQVSEWLAKSWEWIKDKATEIWGAITDFFGGVWDSIKSIFTGGSEDSEGIITGWLDSVKEFITGIWDSILDFYVGIWDSILGLFGTSTKEVFGTVKDWLNRIWDFITDIWDKVLSYYKNIWEAIKALFRGDLKAVGDHLTAAFGGMYDFIQGLWQKVLDFLNTIIGNIASNIRNYFSNIVDNAVSWGSDMLSAARSAAEDVFKAVTDIIGGLPGKMLEIGKNIVSNLADGIRGAASRVKDAASNVVQSVRNLLPFSPAKEGPLKDEPDFADYLMGGMRKAEGQLRSSLAGALDGAAVGAGGYGTANIYLQLDRKTIAKAVGQPLTKDIIAKTGV